MEMSDLGSSREALPKRVSEIRERELGFGEGSVRV